MKKKITKEVKKKIAKEVKKEGAKEIKKESIKENIKGNTEESTEALRELPTLLLAWYDKRKRVLPWREEPTPCRVWISEIMLQQTRVEAVKPYYDRFLKEFPDVSSLAAAKEDRLLKCWEGLGYYNRARNLQKAARQICERFGGELPSEREELLTLSGIGSYTAGAISSIAFGKPYPAVDGNVLRVLARLRADERDILKDSVKRAVEEELSAYLPRERAGEFNQAMMELGALVCIPKGGAKCGECPLESLCMARRTDRVAEFPKKTPKKARRIEEKTILLLQDGEKTALKKRPEKGLLAGLYEFPTLEGHVPKEKVLSYLRKLGIQTVRIRELPPAKHIFTHKEWHMIGYLIRVDELERELSKEAASTFVFAEKEQTEAEYPIPSAFAAYAEYLRIRQGSGRFHGDEAYGKQRE